jgi:two-component system, LytTR family, response regulator
MTKVVVIDDEASGRKLILEYLIYYPEMILVGEANNGVDAVRVINAFKPDLIFLDIQMPGMNGFEVLPHLEEIPQIIFSTAYDKYALKAFEVHAVDYLLKPYTLSRFKQALERIKNPESSHSIQPLAEKLLMDQAKYPERILVQAAKKLITIATSDILRIEAYGDYSKLCTMQETYLSNYGISALEAKLNPDLFIRVHRSAIININFIKEVEKYPGSFEVILLNLDKVTVSRGFMDKFKKLIF